MPQNKAEIRGNLTKDPEFKTLENGNVVCNFTIAVNNNYKKNEQDVSNVSFFDVKTFGEPAEKMKEAKKGMFYTASGIVKENKWEKNGKHFSKIGILAFDVAPAVKGKDSFKPGAYVEFAGNLAADPKIETFESGKTKCSFTIINNSSYEKDGQKFEDKNSLQVELWDNEAKKMAGVKKGDFYLMKGFLKQETWEKGQKKFSTVKLTGIESDHLSKKQEKKEPNYEMGR